jgi:H+-translocating NAD(P) transhydrogenase subunit alpha
MILGIPREIYPGERRVALVPAVIASLTKAGLQVVVEAGAGEPAGYADADYMEKGARIIPERAEVFNQANILLQVLCHGANDKTGKMDLPLMRRGQVVIGFLRPLGTTAVLEEVAATGVTSFAMELMPRITRAQSMDALSSMGTISGYKAVLMAADRLPRMFPMMTTAAGTITPARVFVIGAGVAGLQAIACARRLGAVVSAYDVRPAVKEQILSLGGRFVELPIEARDAQDGGGYAKEQSQEFYQKQRELLAKVISDSNVVITTAVIPGKMAPVLVTEDMVKSMAPGSVLVDLAAERGGNCECTIGGQIIVNHNVTIIGLFNIAGMVPYHASSMYARNLSAFLLYLVKDGKPQIDAKDEIINATLLTRDGAVVNPFVRSFFSLPALTPQP